YLVTPTGRDGAAVKGHEYTIIHIGQRRTTSNKGDDEDLADCWAKTSTSDCCEKPRMRPAHDITKHEEVVAMAILAILMPAAAPSLGDWMSRTRMRNAAESVHNGLNQARMEAVRRNRAVGFYLVSSLDDDCQLS